MLIKKPDPPTTLIAVAVIFIVLLGGYLVFTLVKIKQLSTVETVLFASTKITDITADTITTEDTTIKVTNFTEIQRTAPAVPYSLQKNKDRQLPNSRIGLNDLKPGDMISVIQKNGSATTLTLLDAITAFNGLVVSNEGVIFTVRSLLPATIDSIYTVKTTPDTEITTPQNAQPIVIPLSQIKVGDRVNVYTNDNLTRTIDVTALKLDLIPSMPIAPAISNGRTPLPATP